MNRLDAVQKCANVADSLNYNVFAIQDGGMCLSGPSFHTTFDKDGVAQNCENGKGGRLANSVYELQSIINNCLYFTYAFLFFPQRKFFKYFFEK